MQVPSAYQRSIARWGRLADKEARRYGLGSGAELLAKLLAGESGFRMDAVSYADARGAAQFIPDTRASYVSQYGVDPWRSVDEAVHAAAIYMQKGGGLAAYNPGGGQDYIDYILGQDVSGVPSGGKLPSGGGGQTSVGTPSTGVGTSVAVFAEEERSEALKALLWVAFVLGGSTLVWIGLGRAFGVGRAVSRVVG